MNQDVEGLRANLEIDYNLDVKMMKCATPKGLGCQPRRGYGKARKSQPRSVKPAVSSPQVTLLGRRWGRRGGFSSS